MTNVIRQESGDSWIAYQGDCCEVIKGLPDKSIGFSMFSPPFAELYSYSDSKRDMGNSSNYDDFFKHFGFLAEELHRVIMNGRIVAIHCIDIPAMKERDGYIGLKDFPGDIIRLFQSKGFIYHSRHVIWKDPLIEAVRTKAIGLAHKQLVKDSSRCRAGLPDYVLAFRKKGENDLPINHNDGIKIYYGNDDPGGYGIKRCHNIWRRYASPVWMDIRQSNTLNKTAARDEKDEKHICPLQLDVIHRAMTLWSRKNDTFLTPFGGIGSEGFVAVQEDRKAICIELKDSYFEQLIKNMRNSENKEKQGSLF